jgi:hypothetical protein
MKWIVAAFFLGTAQMAWPQVQTGTSIVYDLSQNQFTIAADSRRNNPETGEYDNFQCKISAFGQKFVFSMSGYVEKINRWNAHALARKIWQKESSGEISADKLTTAVAGKWLTAMETTYSDADIVPTFRKHMFPGDQPILASAIFVATDKSGTVVGRVVNIYFDLQLFDATGTTRLIPDNNPMAETWGGLGFSEIFLEFGKETSLRATEYMKWFTPQISALSHSRHDAKLASKFVELTILLHPRNSELGFPIDLLQLNGGTGVHWGQHKQKCPEN